LAWFAGIGIVLKLAASQTGEHFSGVHHVRGMLIDHPWKTAGIVLWGGNPTSEA